MNERAGSEWCGKGMEAQGQRGPSGRAWHGGQGGLRPGPWEDRDWTGDGGQLVGAAFALEAR